MTLKDVRAIMVRVVYGIMAGGLEYLIEHYVYSSPNAERGGETIAAVVGGGSALTYIIGFAVEAFGTISLLSFESGRAACRT
jgi:hypothetical protein